jgi:glutathione synthase/RimK-type ligase-like ATP-grasp enzyme
MADPAGFVIDDDLAHQPFAALGWRVVNAPWQQRHAWTSFDAVVVRSTWDYPADPRRFLGVLDDIVAAGVPLFNSPDLIRWNVTKTYLADLRRRGVSTVPTIARDWLQPGDLDTCFDALGTDDLVVKPVIGGNATGVFRVTRRSSRRDVAFVEQAHASAPLLVQPFATAVPGEGEYSLFYFDGGYSHAVLKTPAAGDFRVQEEHGATITPVVATEEHRAAGEAALRSLSEVPLYARVDLVRANDGDGFWLMELELVEPSLYLRMHAEAPVRFARAFAARMAVRDAG